MRARERPGRAQRACLHARVRQAAPQTLGLQRPQCPCCGSLSTPNSTALCMAARQRGRLTAGSHVGACLLAWHTHRCRLVSPPGDRGVAWLGQAADCCAGRAGMCGQILRPKAKAAAQTRYFPRYPNYKNASINMFNAGYPADKARPAPCDLNGPRAGHALREEGRKGLAAAPRRRWHRSRAWCVRPAGRRADSGPRGARQSTNAVEMWYSKCVKQRILALAARFSYTCGAPPPRTPARTSRAPGCRSYTRARSHSRRRAAPASLGGARGQRPVLRGAQTRTTATRAARSGWRRTASAT